MGSRHFLSKKLGARISVATLTAQIALGSLSFGLMPTMAMAASDGPLSADVFVNNTDVGTVDWSSPGNAAASEDTRATLTLASSGVSRYLKATDFDFAIPGGATINGITVEVERQAQSSNDVNDNAVRIVKGGVISSAQNKASATFWGTSDAYAVYGGSGDLWGETWTATDINSSTFGVVVSAKRNGGGGNKDARIDHIRITVNYTPAVVDTDSDTVADSTDNCDNTPNLDQINTDGDAEGDACDADDDNDGDVDGLDNCPLTINADQLDTDLDNAGDACDTDDDADGVTDGVDNCPLNGNADQLNTDGLPDGGNACDADDDEDGDLDGADNCPINPNADQKDTDGDLAGDACENEAYIKVAKETNPSGDLTDFSFTGDITATLSDGETSAVVSVAPGAYTVTEGAAAGWLLTDIVCDDADSTGNEGTRTATYNVIDDEVVTCTFTNTLGASVTIVKTVVNNDGGSSTADQFELTLSEGDADTEFPGNEEGTTFSLTPGMTFSVAEAAYEDYTATLSGSCVGVTSVAGASYVCEVINNDDKPTITVTKIVVDEEEDAKEPGDFSLFVDDGEDDVTVTTDVPAEFAAGAYTIGEVDDEDYDATFGGACAADGTLTLAFGDEAACTITNTAVFVTVCHTPPPTDNTLSVRPSELDGHIGHGDSLGPCEGDEEEDDGAVLICHNGTDKWVSANAVQGHLNHGDTEGACDGGGEEGAICGNSAIEEGEQCDDGDAVGEDGCSAACQIEEGYECTGEPSICEIQEGPAHCGNGNLQTPTGEVCDDGNTANGDGCSAACTIEDGYECSVVEDMSFCSAIEGDLMFHKYVCTGDVTLNRETNGPSAEGSFSVPENCSPQSGVQFGSIYQEDKNDTSPPYPGLDPDTTPFTPFDGLTNGAGLLSISDLSTDGRYMVAELDGEGGTVTTGLLAFFCFGDAGAGTNNYEAVFIEGAATVHCVAYNLAATPDDNDADDDGILDEDDNCQDVSNADQDDDDGDEIGDACDETPNGEGGEDDGPGNSENSNGNGNNGEGGNGNGARRGNQMNLIRSIIKLFGAALGDGDIAPGASGGPGDGDFTEDEAKMICTMRKTLPSTAPKSVFEAVANLLATYMPHSAEAILEQLKSGEVCPQPVAHLAIGPKPLAFHVDSAGYPVSSNETANKCIRGTVTLEDLRNNTDRDEDGFGYGCGRYHTGNLWKLDGVYFTWNEKSRTVTLLTDGYVVKKHMAVTQN